MKRVSRVTILVVALCWGAILFEGYDLVVYGNVVPALLSYRPWALTPTEAGAFGSYAVIGMLFGALGIGMLADLIGRKKTLLASVTWTALFMVASGFAPTPGVFGVFRFLTGLGLGGLIPTVTAITLEYAPDEWRTFTFILMYTGYNVGGVVAALLAMSFLPSVGWRPMFWFAAIPFIVVVPLAARYVPESMSYLYAKGQRAQADELGKRFNVSPPAVDQAAAGSFGAGVVSTLFSRSYLSATIAFWVSSFMGLFMIFGVNTWLPTFLRGQGYSLASALTFVLVLNLGAIAGNLLTGAAMDRWGARRLCSWSFVIAIVSFALLSARPPVVVAYILVALAGVGTMGTQNLVNAFVGLHYPGRSRGSAVGWSLGVGRIGGILAPLVGGVLVSMRVGVQWNFYTYALAGLLGMLAILQVHPNRSAGSLDTPAGMGAPTA